VVVPAVDRKATVTEPATPPSRRALLLGIGGAAFASGLTYLVTQALSAASTPDVNSALRTAQNAAHALLTSGSMRSKHVTVDASGGGDFRTIASAYTDAKPGERIIVLPGTYKETLMIRRDVWIAGEGDRSKVIVEFAGALGVDGFAFSGGVSTLTGFTIRGVGPLYPANPAGAISVMGGTPLIEDCDLTSSCGSAVYIFNFWSAANPTFRNCTIRDSPNSGISVNLQGQGTIEKCVISGNSSGLSIMESGSLTVRACQIRGNQIGVLIHNNGRGTFTGNTLTANVQGAWNIQPTAGNVVRTRNIPNM